MIRRLVGEDVEVVWTPASELGRIRADPGSLEQIVMNLVVNARDAMPTGGVLTIETANVALDEADASRLGTGVGPHVVLRVTDTGTGMDSATRARVFEPFFTTKPVGKGTGLGLSTVFGIVQQTGGGIGLESEPGSGTAFSICLPRVADPLERPPQAIAPTILRGNETILLVEDNDQLRAVANGILTRFGYSVLQAASGAEALRLCEEHRGEIHLLLSDVVMPAMSGPELAERIANLHPEARVLCMSGYTDDSIARHGVLEAQFAFLQKPFTPETLARRVREVLGPEAAISPRAPSAKAEGTP